MLPNLKLEIFRRGGHQNRLAKALGIDETVLSKIIHGYRAPTETQRRLLATYLGADEAWLFERFEASSLPGVQTVEPEASKKKAVDDGNV